jgi:DNA-binding MurR/RpiR family transcriptional regulator
MDAVERYLNEMERALRALSRDEVRRVVGALLDAWRWSKTAWIMADGGVIASYLADELHNASHIEGRNPLRVRRLAGQHDAICAGDVVIALFGASGPDYVASSIARAKEVGALTVAFCGSPNGAHVEAVDFYVTVPAERYTQREDAYTIVVHAIALALRERIELQAVGDANSAAMAG